MVAKDKEKKYDRESVGERNGDGWLGRR